MIITRDFLNQVAQNASCCRASLARKYRDRLRSGSDANCIKEDLLLLSEYVDILTSFTLETDACGCSLYGVWTAESDFFGNGTLYFYPNGTARWYIDSDSFVTFFWELGDNFLNMIFYQDGTPIVFTLFPTGESLFTNDCAQLSAYNSVESSGEVATAAFVDIDGKFTDPYVTLDGVVIFQWDKTLYSQMGDESIWPNNIIPVFVQDFNAGNTAGIILTDAALQEFIANAPITGISYNGKVLGLYDLFGNLIQENTFGGGVNPIDADISLTITTKDPQETCCLETNCITERQLKDIIKHVSKICNLYKCC